MEFLNIIGSISIKPDWANITGAVLKAGTPLSITGVVANNANAIGLLANEAHKGDGEVNVVYAGLVDIGEVEASYGSSLADDCKAALKAVQPYKLELPIAFDWEYDSRSYMLRHGVTPTPDLINSIVKAFCSTVENDGYYAMNYSNPDILNSLMTDVAAYDLWLAHWNGTPATTSPSRPCGMWQYGGTYVDGIGSGIDTSEAYRDYPALIRSVGLNHLADEPEPTEGDLAEAWAVERGIVEADYDPGEPMTLQSVIELMYRLHGKENE